MHSVLWKIRAVRMPSMRVLLTVVTVLFKIHLRILIFKTQISLLGFSSLMKCLLRYSMRIASSCRMHGSRRLDVKDACNCTFKIYNGGWTEWALCVCLGVRWDFEHERCETERYWNSYWQNTNRRRCSTLQSTWCLAWNASWVITDSAAFYCSTCVLTTKLSVIVSA